jgi:predicted KAP-like P-loop ATPase
MFVNDRPIENKKDDKLSRYAFSSTLAKSIIEWKGTDSLVIALYGKWGSGKSSVINLAKTEISECDIANKPTVIEFNPWLFSGEDKLNEHFFNEIAKELEIQNTSEKDTELADRLRSYSRLFGLIPEETFLSKVIEKGLIILGLLGLSTGQFLQWLNVNIGSAKNILFVAGIVLVIISSFRKSIDGLADYLEKKSIVKQKTVLSFKKEIKDTLLKRDNKILIIIDDIDRLTSEEIRLIFKLIKINTDFPNVIYLLSFDPEVAQKALEKQPGIDGKNYIEKIVQVSFDIPFVKQEKITKILFAELDRVLEGLPKSSEKLFDQTYWGNIYHSGFKNFFRNIRDVKRFASSLEFNFKLMFNGESMEVNPIDFIAIEAIRVFTPDFYNFLRTNGELFVSVERDRYGSAQENTRKKEIENAINKIDERLREDLKELLKRLFPQVDGVFQYGYSSHGHEWIAIWSRQLKVCSPKFFDAYFTLIPGGDESELSQFEIDLLFAAINDQPAFEKIMRDFMKKGKVRKVLERMEDYTGDAARIPENVYPTVVQTLFNISDGLPKDRQGMFDFGSDIQCARIIYQLMRGKDKGSNFNILRDAAKNSTGLYGPIYMVSLEQEGNEKEKRDLVIVEDDKLKELAKICLEKIKEHRTAGTLITNKSFLSILYRWKNWSATDDWKKYAEEITVSDQGLFDFMKHFISESYSQTFGDYVGKKKKSFDYEGLNKFISADQVKVRLEELKKSNSQSYLDNQEMINMFLDNFGKKLDALTD